MAQDNHGKHDGQDEGSLAESGDAALLLKKRARRRLIGAAALALFAAIVLPMVMDHQPAPPLKDIQVRIPSPDEGVSQRIASPVEPVAPSSRESTKPIAPRPEAQPEIKVAVPAPAPAASAKPEPAAESKPESKPDPKTESKPDPKPETRKTTTDIQRAQDALAGKEAAEVWEIQLGAYREPGRVKLLVGKLKELGVSTYTEKVDTPNGPRTRVRAGPYPTQQAAEKARERVKIVGVDGPVAKKP